MIISRVRHVAVRALRARQITILDLDNLDNLGNLDNLPILKFLLQLRVTHVAAATKDTLPACNDLYISAVVAVQPVLFDTVQLHVSLQTLITTHTTALVRTTYYLIIFSFLSQPSLIIIPSSTY